MQHLKKHQKAVIDNNRKSIIDKKGIGRKSRKIVITLHLEILGDASGSGERAHEVNPDCSEERREGGGVWGETKHTTIATMHSSCCRARHDSQGPPDKRASRTTPVHN